MHTIPCSLWLLGQTIAGLKRTVLIFKRIKPYTWCSGMQLSLSMAHGSVEKFSRAFRVEPERNIGSVMNLLTITATEFIL